MVTVRGQITITNVNDGTPGRGIVNVTEHYKASTRFTDLSAPDGINYPDWGTIPFPNDWNTSNKYLWNYEKIEYSNGDIVRTTPRVITVYGKTIDSIENYYLATNDTAVTKNTEGWTSSIQTMSPENKYLWNYEKISYVELSGNTLYYVEPHIIGVYGEKGESGEDALNVICTPSALIINLNINNKTNLDSLSSDNSAKCTIQVYKGNTKLDVTNLSKSSSNCSSTASVSSGNGYIQINSISKDGTNYYDKGYITLIITANDNGTSRQIKNIKIPFYCNLLGTWKEIVENDTKTIAAQKVVTEMNERGVLTTTSNEYTSLASSTQALESWKSTAQSTINGHTTSINNQNTRLTTAESNINTVKKEVESEQLLPWDGWSAMGIMEKQESSYYISVYYDEDSDEYPSLNTPEVGLPAGDYCFFYYTDHWDSYDYTYNNEVSFEGEVINHTYTRSTASDWNGYDKHIIKFTLTSRGKVSINIEEADYNDLNIYRPMLNSGNSPKAFNPNLKLATESSISQTADTINLSIRNGLEETGINIGTKKIVAKTNNFEIRNSSNQKTFGIDADGNLEARGSATFKGAVKASRYYDNVEFLYRSANPQTITLTNLVGTYFIRNGTSNSFEIILPDPDNHDGLELTFYGSSVDSPRGDIIINCNASWAYPNNGSGLYAFRTVGDLYINNSIIGMDVLDILFPCLNDLSQMNVINLSLIHSGPATLKLKSARDTGHISNHNLWIIIEGSNIVLAKGTYNVAI